MERASKRRILATLGITVALLSVALLTMYFRHVGLDWLTATVVVGVTCVLFLARPFLPGWLRSPVDVLTSPFLQPVRAEAEQRNKNEKALTSMDLCLHSYGLGRLPPSLRDKLVDHDESLGGKATYQLCAEEMAKRLGPPATPTLLEFLYTLEANALESKRLWFLYGTTSIAPGLAFVLARCDKLRGRRERFPFTEAMLKKMLEGMAEYDFHALDLRLELAGGAWDRTGRYREFLEKNGVRCAEPKAEAVWDCLEEGPALLAAAGGAWDEQVVTRTETLRRMGETALATLARRSASVNASLCRVSMGMFFSKEYPERPPHQALPFVCFEASRDEKAQEMILAFLEMEDKRPEAVGPERGFVSVSRLARHWRECVQRLREETAESGGALFGKDMREIRQMLQEERWPMQLFQIRQREFDKVRTDLKEETAKVRETAASCPGLVRALQSAFRRLNPSTIERFLETQEIAAYLITFDCLVGPLADLIDCLLGKTASMRNFLGHRGVQLEADGKPKYVFKDYTKNARIGLVPKGWAFDRFYKEFNRDMGEVLAQRRNLLPASKFAKGDLEQVELIVQRFGLVGRTHYVFRSRWERLEAVNNLRELFAGSLDVDDLLAVIGYQQAEIDQKVPMPPIIELMMEGSLSDLIGLPLKENDRERLEENEASKKLKEQFLATQGFSRATDLGRALRADPERAVQAEADLTSLLQTQGPMFCRKPAEDGFTAADLAQDYVATLRAIAGLEAGERTGASAGAAD